jgi:hypothetical protein
LGVDGKYGAGVLYDSGRVPVGIFGGMGIDIRKIFRQQIWR